MPLLMFGKQPPLRTCAPSRRQLHEMGCFFQRPLASEGDLASAAQKRGLWVSRPSQDRWEHWDEFGVVRPVAFAQTANLRGASAPAIPGGEPTVFRDERDYQPWATYVSDAYGHPHVSALFTSGRPTTLRQWLWPMSPLRLAPGPRRDAGMPSAAAVLLRKTMDSFPSSFLVGLNAGSHRTPSAIQAGWTWRYSSSPPPSRILKSLGSATAPVTVFLSRHANKVGDLLGVVRC